MCAGGACPARPWVPQQGPAGHASAALLCHGTLGSVRRYGSSAPGYLAAGRLSLGREDSTLEPGDGCVCPFPVRRVMWGWRPCLPVACF